MLFLCKMVQLLLQNIKKCCKIELVVFKFVRLSLSYSELIVLYMLMANPVKLKKF